MAYGSNKVLDRKPTLYYLYDKFIKGERLIVSRYNDGEYLLMHGQDTKMLKPGTSEGIKDLLNNSLKDKRQFVCTAYIRSDIDVPEKNIWYKTHKYVTDNNHELYGSSNWATYDFCYENKLVPLLFSDKTLVISGLCQYLLPIMKPYNKNLDCYSAPIHHAERQYDEIKNKLFEICSNYKNIIFSCGPTGKVLLVDLIDKCNANLVDLGALINAICHKEDMWTMSWATKIDLKLRTDNFLSRVKNELV